MKIVNCRLCSSGDITKVVDLGYHPLADTFLPEELLYAGPEFSYPLQLGLCGSCGHVSTLFSVSAEDRYQKQDYSYDSSNSPVAIAHFKEFAETVLKDLGEAPTGLVVDIGSNVGTLLAHFKTMGCQNVLGVEPSRNIAKLATQAGIPTLNDFFGANAAMEICGKGPVDILLSSNVVNHADDLVALLATARKVLSTHGIFVFEVPYLLDLIKGTAFDTIYHEHVHYYGIKPLLTCFERQGFSIYKIERIDYMCGSVRVYTRFGGVTDPALKELVRAEELFGLYEVGTYRKFMDRVRNIKFTVNAHLSGIRAEGGKIIGIGAATKGNTFLNYCRLDSEVISYIADASPLKHGKLTPGSHIPIVADTDIGSDITHALILPWNIAPFLKEKLSHLELSFYVPQVETVVNLGT